ncbi:MULTISPECIES: hypothetical protein [Sphingomonas]|jgi:hypothetical protein|uniref:Uncharacterized protein n=1 Tax=Sphingomonas turrisvirgatae TaxID=1888892 RepID=A0A1E3LY91_9SPHN|nr:hypothetical protein [Sphingomonas turrisvirgatae]ODP38802.1 hypothetical protein BFL28_13505 [Sphingomonas turrisvirgatae]
MPIRSWCIASPALLPTILILPSPSQAQTYRPDAEGYPCAARTPLAVASTDQGFTIEPRRQVPTRVAAQVERQAVAIGSSLKLDRSIFVTAGNTDTEAEDAARR